MMYCLAIILRSLFPSATVSGWVLIPSREISVGCTPSHRTAGTARSSAWWLMLWKKEEQVLNICTQSPVSLQAHTKMKMRLGWALPLPAHQHLMTYVRCSFPKPWQLPSNNLWHNTAIWRTVLQPCTHEICPWETHQWSKAVDAHNLNTMWICIHQDQHRHPQGLPQQSNQQPSGHIRETLSL